MITLKMQHYDNIRQDIRDEIKMRIRQRDGFAVQYFVSMGAIILGTISEYGNYYLLLMLPVIAIYFTTQILYSYYIHDMMCFYLKEKLEIKIAGLLEEDYKLEWENFTHNNRLASNIKVPGIRRNFFVMSMWVTTFIAQSTLALWMIKSEEMHFYNIIIITISTIVFILLDGNITYKFISKAKNRNHE